MTTRRKPTRKGSSSKTAPTEAAAPPAPPPSRRQRRARQAAVPLGVEMPQVGVSRQAEPTTRAAPQPAYYLVFNRDRWDFIGGRVVPQLSKAKILPGANGVGVDRSGKPLPGMMLAQIEENGHQVIPWDVDGPGTSYLRRDPATGGWYSRWERVFPGSSAVHSDTEGYAEWLEGLIDRGVLEPAPIYVLERLLGRYQGLAAETSNKPARANDHAGYLQAIEVIGFELEAARAEEEVPELELQAEETPELEAGTPDLGTGEPTTAPPSEG